MYDIVFACAGLLLFSLSLFDDKAIGIVLNIMSFMFFLASAIHLAVHTEYYYYSYVMFFPAFISLVLAILRSVDLLRVRRSW